MESYFIITAWKDINIKIPLLSFLHVSDKPGYGPGDGNGNQQRQRKGQNRNDQKNKDQLFLRLVYHVGNIFLWNNCSGYYFLKNKS